MIGKRFRFLAQHGRGLFVWAVIVIAGIQLWLVPFGVGASPTKSSQTPSVSTAASAESSGWTSPATMTALHHYLHPQHKHQ